jgi:hypothetical protein
MADKRVKWIHPLFNKIEIEFPNNADQRYSTLGDWYFKNGTLKITSSREQGFKSAISSAIHELIETVECLEKGITQEVVDKFDMTHTQLYEPGMSPDAPYHRQHLNALAHERMLCRAIGLSWKQHVKNMEIAWNCKKTDKIVPVPCKVRQNKRMKDM